MLRSSSVSVFGKTIPVWILIAGIVGSGSLAIAVQPVSDEKIHIQDTTGRIQTNVPVAASRAFSPLPVQWNQDNSIAYDTDNDGSFSAAEQTGSDIATKQKIVFNFVADAATRHNTLVWFDNLSEDNQIFIIRAGAPPNVAIDIEQFFPSTPVHGLVGHNEWLVTVPPGPGYAVEVEVSTTDAGFYPIVLELDRVG